MFEEEKKIVEMAATISGGASMTASASLKHSLSHEHLRAARYFVKQCKEIEKTQDSSSSGDEPESYRPYVIGAVILATAAMEASINDLYLEAEDRNRTALQGLDDSVVARLAESWKGIERGPLLKKYQNALQTAGVTMFQSNHPPYMDADDLIRLRNALVHYKPEWDNEANMHKDLEERLTGNFPLNPFPQQGSLWFPHRCLGAGCAKWAVEVVERFMEEFCARMTIPYRFRAGH